ncbi:ABC transporter ATP-binding protein [Metabacillus sp. SLBN-84]
MILETKGLTKVYGKQEIVSGVNLQLEKGQIYGFLGPNGAGKTTTMRMILGLTKQARGEILLFGKSLKTDRIQILKRIGSLIETPSFYSHLTGLENVRIAAKLYGVDDRKRVDEVFSLVRLEHAIHRKAGTYSLGMKQRLGLAMALIHRPELLILDEPTNGLDPEGIQEMRELIKNMPSIMNTTVLVSSHLLSEVEQMATHVGIIHQGSMKFQGTMEELKKQNSGHLLIRTNDPERAWSILKEKGFIAKLQGDQLKISDARPEIIQQIQQQLISNDVTILRMEEEKSSLEKMFMQMTKRENAS